MLSSGESSKPILYRKNLDLPSAIAQNIRKGMANMKYLFLTAALFVAGCSFLPGVTGSGKFVTRQMPLGSFNRIDASGTFHVVITQGTASSVVITADDNVWNSIEIRNDSGTLRLSMKSGSYNNVHVSAEIVMPQLNAITLSGATEGSIQNFNDAAGRVDLNVNGASKLEAGLRQRQVTLNLSGASTATLHGKADVVNLTVSGASHGGLEDFASDAIRADISGASNATVTAHHKLDYEVSGASHLSYAGSPTIGQASVSGASSVQ
jgi:Putative auto-transporter adhesin, head GIN domain